MMVDVYVLNKNLEPIGLIDTYKSLIWSNRYNDLGDCEIYVEATAGMLELLKKDYYLCRSDDSMVCQIKKIELDTNSQTGNYLIITGKDAKGLLDQRIIWSTITCNGNVEAFGRELVNLTCINPKLSYRALLKENGTPLIQLGNVAGFKEAVNEQVSYKNVGEKIREYCQSYGWGYRLVYTGLYLWFQFYKGTDRSNYVIFSSDYENINSTKYVEDYTNMANVALVGGEGQGSARSRNVSGYAEGIDRYEIFVDAKDISKTITWQQLTSMYPTTDKGGQGYIDHNGVNYVYKMNYLNVEIVDSDQLTQLKINYPDGHEISINNVPYYQVYNVIIANLPNNSPQDTDNVELWSIVYEVYLLNRGYEKLAEYGSKKSFEGSIAPNVTFEYKKDYFLGDIVTVENEFGVSVAARITEVVEVFDNKGYSVEPKFEYKKMNTNQKIEYLSTEDDELLTTEDNEILEVEKNE